MILVISLLKLITAQVINLDALIKKSDHCLTAFTLKMADQLLLS